MRSIFAEIYIKYAEEIKRWDMSTCQCLCTEKAQGVVATRLELLAEEMEKCTWDSGRCESGKTGSLHWFIRKAGSIGRKRIWNMHFAQENPGRTSDRFSTCLIIIDDIYTAGIPWISGKC